MRKSLLIALLAASAVWMRADFTYQETTQMTGGSMINMLKALGPLTRAAREPIVSTHIVKGNRMASITKDRTTIIDLDKETITTIDNGKKTYSVMTFAEMKQAMEDAMRRAQERARNGKAENANNPQDVQAQFKISAKATGQTKVVQGLNAKEMLITFGIEGKDTKTGDTGAMEMTSDAWYAPLPGYNEVKEFHKRMAVKLGYMFGSNMQQISQMMAAQGGGNFNANMEELAKEMSKIDGVPVETVVKMGVTATPAGNGQAGSSQPQPQAQSQPQQQPSATGAIAGALAGRLGGFGGFGRRKKNNDEPQEQPAPQQSSNGSQTAPGSLMEMTMTLTSFSSGPADTSKFEIPAGYKQVEPDLRRAGRQ
jgi:uncharacterized protein YfcZ (UPF0381/DUF406 family)